MLKFEQNSKKIKFTTLKYLYEIAAIPFDIRDEYLQKLLNRPKTGIKRKNSTDQKNVRLLKEIYKCVENESISDWNEERICLSLNISQNMLYCHKHYILKGIRELFFNWKEVERKEFKKDKQDTNNIGHKFKRAILMNDIGMVREAKIEFFKIIKLVESKKSNDINNELILLRVYEKLCIYYYHQKNRHKFNFFHLKVEELSNNLLYKIKVKNINSSVLEINIILNNCLSKKISFNIKGQKIYPRIIKLYKKIIVDAKKINNFDLACKMYINLGLTYQDLQSYDKSMEYYRKGLKIATKLNMIPESINFRISITAVEFLSGKLNLNDCLSKMNELYNNIENIILKECIKEGSLFQFICVTSTTDRNDLLCNYLEKYNSFKITIYGYKSTMRMLYYMKFTYYLSKILEFGYGSFNDKSEKAIIVKGVKQDIIKKLDDLEMELLSNFDKKYTLYFKLEALMFMLEVEFWKGKFMNYDKIMGILQKIDWLLKTRRKIFQLDNELFEIIEIIKTCSKIIEGSKFIKEIDLLNKFGEKFDEFVANLPNKNKENIISGFTILSYTAEQSGCNLFKENVKKSYFKLEEKYPGIFDSIKEQIENGKNKKIDAIQN
jgi:hypothetical protein